MGCKPKCVSYEIKYCKKKGRECGPYNAPEGACLTYQQQIMCARRTHNSRYDNYYNAYNIDWHAPDPCCCCCNYY